MLSGYSGQKPKCCDRIAAGSGGHEQSIALTTVAMNRFDRQVLMFGEAGQRKLEAQRPGIVGAGGIGSHIAQGLAYLGVQRFGIVDDDQIDETNLNRVVGAGPGDLGQFKTDVAKRNVLKILPGADVASLPVNLRTREAFDLLRGCSIILGCLDHDGPRLVLTEFAAAYRIPLIDIATEIFPAA